MADTDKLTGEGDHTVLAVMRSQVSDIKSQTASANAKMDSLGQQLTHFSDRLGSRIGAIESENIRHAERIAALKIDHDTLEIKFDRTMLSASDHESRLVALENSIKDLQAIKRAAYSTLVGIIILGALGGYYVVFIK